MGAINLLEIFSAYYGQLKAVGLPGISAQLDGSRSEEVSV